MSEDDLARDLAYQRFVRSCPSPEFARHAAISLSNFELYLKKVFWVGESLSWMLGATQLNVTGDAVRLPFRSLALVFTDRYALGLAERMDSRLPPELRTGRMLQVLTVFVTQTWGEDSGADTEPRLFDLTLVGEKDQRPRWVRPHWRGPSAAAIVERQPSCFALAPESPEHVMSK